MRQPKRARELEKIIERTGTLYPKDYWPLEVISCWLGGTVGYQSSRLAEYYGNVPARDLGYVSTEGRHTIPLGDQSSDGVLYPHGAYYEFAAAGDDSGPDRRTLEAHELEVGCDYSPIISTSNGLYRYDLGDVVRCKGFLGQSPILEFLHKTAQYSDMEGEKISGHQIAQAVESTFRRLELPPELVSALPTRGDRGPSYYGILTDSDALRDDVHGPAVSCRTRSGARDDERHVPREARATPRSGHRGYCGCRAGPGRGIPKSRAGSGVPATRSTSIRYSSRRVPGPRESFSWMS